MTQAQPLDHDVIRAMLDVLIFPEDQLLFSIVALPAVVATVASDHRPFAFLHHEIHQLHRFLSHVVLTLRPSPPKCTGRQLQVTIVRVVVDPVRFPTTAEERLKLLEDVVLVLTVHFDISHLPQLNHDQRCNHVQRVRRFELHLLLPNLSSVPHLYGWQKLRGENLIAKRPKVPPIADLQCPAALFGHELGQLHGQLAHVILPLPATCFVDMVWVLWHPVFIQVTEGEALVTQTWSWTSYAKLGTLSVENRQTPSHGDGPQEDRGASRCYNHSIHNPRPHAHLLAAEAGPTSLHRKQMSCFFSTIFQCFTNHSCTL